MLGYRNNRTVSFVHSNPGLDVPKTSITVPSFQTLPLEFEGFSAHAKLLYLYQTPLHIGLPSLRDAL